MGARLQSRLLETRGAAGCYSADLDIELLLFWSASTGKLEPSNNRTRAMQ